MLKPPISSRITRRILIQGQAPLAQAKPSSAIQPLAKQRRAVAAKPCWLMVGMISQFMKWESLAENQPS